MKSGKKEKAKSPQKKVEQSKEENKKGGNNPKEKNQKSPNKNGVDNKKTEEAKKKGEEEKKKQTFKLDFIYRREQYTLKNLITNCQLSKIKKLISQKIQVNVEELKFFYKEKELKAEDDKKVVYEMIKDDKVPFFEVRKELPINQNIISLNTKVNLVYKVKCKPISDYIDLIKKIEQFFKDVCLEAHYLCEPTSTDSYDVCFSCSDHCFQFKRYMMNISRTDKLYEKTTYEILKVNKDRIIEPKNEYNKKNSEEKEKPKIEIVNTKFQVKKKDKIIIQNEVDVEYRKMKHLKNDYFQKDFINSGPYEKYEEIKKKEEKANENKIISKEKFSPYFKFNYEK